MKTKHRTHAEAAITWLKKQALAMAAKGLAGRYGDSYSIGQIMRGLEIAGSWDSRTKAYNEVLAAVKQAHDLGLVAQRYGENPRRFYYDGPEVADICETRRKHREKCLKKTQAAARRLGAGCRVNTHDQSVTIPERVFWRIVKKLHGAKT